MRQLQCPKCGNFKITDLHRQIEWMYAVPMFIVGSGLICYTSNVSTINPNWGWVILIGLVVIGKLISNPYKNNYVCNKCSYQWREPK